MDSLERGTWSVGEREAARKSPGFWPEHWKSQTCPFLRQERQREARNGTQFRCSKECLQTSTESAPMAKPIAPPQLVFYQSLSGSASSQPSPADPVTSTSIVLYAPVLSAFLPSNPPSSFPSLPVAKGASPPFEE